MDAFLHFYSIGRYYVNNEYHHPDYDPEGPLPSQVDLSYLFRNILADRPIVTRINIDWSGNGAIEMPPPQEDCEDMEDCLNDDGQGPAEDGQELLTEDDTIDVDRMQTQSNRVL